MTWTSIAILSLVAVLLASGQVLFKIAAQSSQSHAGANIHIVLEFALNPFFLAGLVVYAVATFVWVILLRDNALNKAYLVVALSLVLVSVAGTILFKEPVSVRLVAGILIIILGLLVALW